MSTHSAHNGLQNPVTTPICFTLVPTNAFVSPEGSNICGVFSRALSTLFLISLELNHLLVKFESKSNSNGFVFSKVNQSDRSSTNIHRASVVKGNSSIGLTHFAFIFL